METPPPSRRAVNDSLANFPLLTALRERRSRRFGRGMKIPAGPLAYESKHPPQPLTEDEEAALVFAACGITGHALADLAYARRARAATSWSAWWRARLPAATVCKP